MCCVFSRSAENFLEVKAVFLHNLVSFFLDNIYLTYKEGQSYKHALLEYKALSGWNLQISWFFFFKSVFPMVQCVYLFFVTWHLNIQMPSYKQVLYNIQSTYFICKWWFIIQQELNVYYQQYILFLECMRIYPNKYYKQSLFLSTTNYNGEVGQSNQFQHTSYKVYHFKLGQGKGLVIQIACRQGFGLVSSKQETCLLVVVGRFFTMCFGPKTKNKCFWTTILQLMPDNQIKSFQYQQIIISMPQIYLVFSSKKQAENVVPS
eukprot:TRINITY_DN11944_c0_g1_i3.p2 TRINITY_DN11944_c0_g1~~TRINITY_DN11944_c0_g1_i3.p2  ORF type:complete len:262 (-),score=-9.59 TRINITY_DN11944_c0_g1_i3:562-1347(-)